jgi:hypothetical protein
MVEQTLAGRCKWQSIARPVPYADKLQELEPHGLHVLLAQVQQVPQAPQPLARELNLRCMNRGRCERGEALLAQ